jgi:hypothetical protein
MHCHFGIAPFQWICFGVADLPSNPAEPPSAVVGIEMLVPTVGALLALSAALAAACFVKAFGITFLGRARTGAAQSAHDRRNCAGFIHRRFIAPVVTRLVGDRMPVQLQV